MYNVLQIASSQKLVDDILQEFDGDIKEQNQRMLQSIADAQKANGAVSATKGGPAEAAS